MSPRGVRAGLCLADAFSPSSPCTCLGNSCHCDFARSQTHAPILSPAASGQQLHFCPPGGFSWHRLGNSQSCTPQLALSPLLCPNDKNDEEQQRQQGWMSWVGDKTNETEHDIKLRVSCLGPSVTTTTDQPNLEQSLSSKLLTWKTECLTN